MPASAPVASAAQLRVATHADARGVERLRLLARGAQVQADVGRAEDPHQQPGEGEAEVDEQRLGEEARPEHRDLVEQRDRDGRGRAQARVARAELGTLQDARDPLPGERDRDPDDDLVEAEPDAQRDHQRRADHPAERPEQEPQPRRVAVVGAEEAEVGAEQHHPLEAEVEHAGALGDRLAERREHQRQPREQAAGDQRGQDGLAEDARCSRARHAHVVASVPRRRGSRRRISGWRSALRSPGVR